MTPDRLEEAREWLAGGRCGARDAVEDTAALAAWLAQVHREGAEAPGRWECELCGSALIYKAEPLIAEIREAERARAERICWDVQVNTRRDLLPTIADAIIAAIDEILRRLKASE